jgi:translocation and assembly module TamB
VIVRKSLRILGIVGGCFALIILLGYLGLDMYLASGHAKRLASEQLSSLLGGNIRVTELEAGVGSTEVHVEVLSQPAADGRAPAQPIVTGTVRANVGPIGLAAGSSPSTVTLSNAQVTLHFDKDGNLTDKLPEPQGQGGGEKLPAITVKGAAVTLKQEGKPDFHASGIDVSVADDGKLLKITGRASDPTWKGWKLSGEWSKAGGSGSIVLQTEDRVAVNPEMLKSVPFVPPETWQWAVLTADTNCTVKIDRGADKRVSYRVELDPQNARLTVPPIDLTTTGTTGKVVVENAVVTLTDVNGQTAGGKLHVDSRLDFAADPSRLTFQVDAHGLNIPQLPKTWGLPHLEAGKLEGKANIELVVKDGQVQPWGRGEADIVGGRLFGGTVEGKVTLVGDGKRLRFDSDVAAVPRKRLGGGLDAAAALVATMLQAPAQPPPKSAEPAPKKGPTYVQAHLRLKEIDLAELVQQLQVKIPIRVTGRASLDVQAEIPVAEARTLRAYRIHGKLTVPTLGLQDLTLNNVAADVVFREGVLTLTNLSGDIPQPGDPSAAAGTFVGTARYGVDPQTDLTADLKLTAIPLAQMFKAFPDLGEVASGQVSGSATLTAPGAKLGDVTAYVADGTLSSPSLTAFGRRAEKVALTLALRKGVARIADASAVVEGLPVTGSASVTLAGKYPYTATVKTDPADVVAIQRLVPEADIPVELSGKLATTTDLKGTLNPVTVTAAGTATATGLVIGTAKVEKLVADWSVTEDVLTLTNIRSDLYKGTIVGSARFPLKAAEAGGFAVTFQDVDAAAVTRAVPSTPIKLEGAVSGTLKGTLPPQRGGEQRRATVALTLTAPRLKVQGIPTERLKGKIDYKPGLLAYDLTGETLGGSFDLNGTYPLGEAKTDEPKKDGEPVAAGQPQPKKEAASGRIRLTGLRLSRLAGDLGVPALAPLKGLVNVHVTYTFEPGAAGPTGGGQVEVLDLGWGTSSFGETIRAAVRVTETAVEVPELSGRFADGTLRGRVRYNFVYPRRSFYTLTLDGADAGKLLGPFGFDAVNARVTVATRGNIGRELRGSGTASFSRGQVTGFQLAEVRLPFDWSYTPGSGGRLGVRDLGGQAAGGRITGEATVSWGTSVQAEGRLKFVDLSFRALLGQFGQSSGLGSGRMNGQFTFSGTDMRSCDDLTGQLVATLGEGPVYDLPVFSQLAQYLVPSVSARGLVPFNEGELRGRLAKGQFRVQRFALTGPSSKLFLDGTIGVRTGRLDLDAVAMTGQVGLNVGILRGYARRLLPIGPVPAGLILEVSRLLSNRTIRARVTGTINQPIVTVNLAGLLTEEAIRFFLEPYLPFPR